MEDRKVDQIEREIEDNLDSLESMQRMQEEINRLNDSLNACIAIASTSVVSGELKKKYDNMKENNHNSFARSNQTLENAIEVTRRNIAELNEERDMAEDQEEEPNEEEKERA